MTRDDAMTMYTIYFNPRDCPDMYVVRKFLIGHGTVQPTDTAWASTSLESARALIPPGLVCMERDPNDEPQVVETWF